MVVPFAKKKRKGYSDEPPDVEATDDFVDEMEYEEEKEEVDDDDGNALRTLVMFRCFLSIGNFGLCLVWRKKRCTGHCILAPLLASVGLNVLLL